MEHEHTKQLGLIVDEQDGENKHISHPAFFSEVDIVKPTKVPSMGEHSREILREFCNYDDKMIDLALEVVKSNN